MSLSSDLITRFAKAVNAKEEAKKETTQYGTIKEVDNKKYVQLDGSEILTPMSTTVDVTDGDRVTVLIKNHTATITGNVTFPAAKQNTVAVVYDTATGAVNLANGAKKEAETANSTASTAVTAAESAASLAAEARSAAESASDDANQASTNAGEAAKTATNFLYYDDQNGLQVGDKRNGSWSGFRSRMTNTAFEILNAAGTVLASYGANLIELGKDAVNTVIKLCGGKGTISYDSDAEILEIGADDIRLQGKELSSVSAGYTNSSGVSRKSAVNVSPDDVQITSGINEGNGWKTSEVRVTKESVDITGTTVDFTGMLREYKSDGTYVGVIRSSQHQYDDRSGWRYIKWSDGTVELWKTFSVSNIDCKTALGNMYRSGAFSTTSFPFTVNNPVVTASYESDGYGAFLWATTTSTTSKPPSYYLVRPTSTTIVSGKIHFYVRGTY